MPNATELRQLALQQGVDLFRIKIDAQYESEMNAVLETIGMPFYYSHSVLNVKVDYSHAIIESYKNKGVEFELYEDKDGQKDRFFNLIYNGMYNDPIGYYKTPIINNLIKKEKEAACYAQYYVNYYNGSNKNLIGYIMLKDGVDAGCFVFEIQNGNIHSSMAAVLPKYRREGLFHDMKIFHQNYCVKNNFKIAYTGSRINNFHTPNLLLKTGYQIYKVEHVYHVVAMLSKVHLQNNFTPITCKHFEVYQVIWHYLEQNENFKKKISKQGKVNFNFYFLDTLSQANIIITNIIVPQYHHEETFIVFTYHLENVNDTLFGYLRISTKIYF